MTKLLNLVDGYKTHLVALAAILTAISGFLVGDITGVQAVTAIFAALGLSTGRDAIKKLEQ